MKRTLSILLVSWVARVAMAIPADRTPFTHVQTDGTTVVVYPHGDEFHHFCLNAQGEQIVENAQGDWQVADVQLTRSQLQTRHKQGVQRRARKEFGRDPFLAPHGLVILAEFPDKKFTSATPHADFDSLMNGINYNYDGATGSVRQYFIDQSNGQYKPQFTVVGPVTMPHESAYYGTNDSWGYDRYLADFVIDACLAADDKADFSQIDFDNDGYADFVYIVYAGRGEADGGGSSTLWPCSWELSNTLYSEYTNQTTYTWDKLPKLDGKFIENYAISNELRKGNCRAGIGGVCHEYSHVCGLPDVYDSYYGDNYDNSATPGDWHLMDQGAYNNGGKTPPSYSPWDKYFLGWVQPSLLTDACNDTLRADGQTYRYIAADGKAKKATAPTPVYYIENRQQTGWDAYSPGHGMLIWMVNYDGDIWAANEPNASESEEYGKPECNKDGEMHYQLISAAGSIAVRGDRRDPFPGENNVRSYTPLTDYPLTDICETDGVITYQLKGGVTPTPTSILDAVAAESIAIYDLMGRYCGNRIEGLAHGIYTVVERKGAKKIIIP